MKTNRRRLDFDAWLMLAAGVAVVCVGILGVLLAAASGAPAGALFLGAMSVMAVFAGGFIAVDVLRSPIWRD